MILGLHHMGVATNNLERLAQFYVHLFHGKILSEFSWDKSNEALSARLGLASSGRLVMLGFASARLEIFQFSEPMIAANNTARNIAMAGFSHICFQVDDCLTEFNRLQGEGMVFHASPMRMPGGGIFTYGRDPDGNIVELLQVPPSV